MSAFFIFCHNDTAHLNKIKKRKATVRGSYFRLNIINKSQIP